MSVKKTDIKAAKADSKPTSAQELSLDEIDQVSGAGNPIGPNSSSMNNPIPPASHSMGNPIGLD